MPNETFLLDQHSHVTRRGHVRGYTQAKGNAVIKAH